MRLQVHGASLNICHTTGFLVKTVVNITVTLAGFWELTSKPSKPTLTDICRLFPGFNSLLGGIMGFSILISAEVYKNEPKVWYLDGTIGVLIGLIILAYGVR